MGFKKVYKALQEIFPQIDSRVLRAVAIEHSNDADAAVEAVLVEIIPLFIERSRHTNSSDENRNLAESPKAIVEPVATAWTKDASSVNTKCSAEEQNGSTSYDVGFRVKQSFHDANDGHNEPFYDTCSEIHEECGDNGITELISSVQRDENSVKLSVDVSSHDEPLIATGENRANNHHEVSGGPEKEASVFVENCSEGSIETLFDQSSRHTLGSSNDGATCFDRNVYDMQDLENAGRPDRDCNTGILEDNYPGKSCQDGNQLEVVNYVVQPISLTVNDPTLSPSESSAQLAVVSDMQNTNSEQSEIMQFSDDASKVEATSEMVDIQEEYTLNTMVSQSAQICSIDFLEEIISDARNNKKTLFSVMESVIGLMKEVELKEKDAEQAKEEAAKGGFDILSRAEDLKKMLQHAKEANDMHAGEVYGEKAILATELRELQSRVISLSDERDKSLAILDEMRQTLELRLAVAENERKSAVQERLEKEKSSLKALADQEIIMEKVVQESNILNQEAEENAKLREFLVDRGHVVDMLQGEIAVICQDVRLLKEKFDERVPFSKSLSSSQTSCRLASSTSSSRSLVLLQTEREQGSDGADSLENPKRDLVRCFDEQLSGEEATRDDSKALVEEGWEIFDSRDVYV
ncbi:rab11 family-interacting 3 isoform X1 [Olea europaea subsp. europaea]|uniref:Rab11 family-interacting 3 isoform X1 n=1 Tax=Olea europaea subsp. europaea TaxID=158383 RepID=A0A8S0TRN9_OLEEU|nr:rab11 family-interacting 3 isoform X1 [Olea europaea subsp. europaea]